MNVYYEIHSNSIFTYDYKQSCGEAFGLLYTVIIFRKSLKLHLKLGHVIKLGKL